MESKQNGELSNEERQLLVQRYIQLRELNKKTHLCNYYFRMRCLKSLEECTYAHGLDDLVRMPSEQLLEIRQEIYNIKAKLKTNNFIVLYNMKTRRYEVYKSRDIQRLRNSKMKEFKDSLSGTQDPLPKEEEKGGDWEEDDDDDRDFIKKSVSKLDLYQYQEMSEIIEKDQLYEIYEMNRVLDDEDEINKVKRHPRTKEEREIIIKPFQNRLMADFLQVIWYEAGDNIVDKETVINKFNEAGVPLTWQRLNLSRIHFEKKISLSDLSCNGQSQSLNPNPESKLEESKGEEEKKESPKQEGEGSSLMEKEEEKSSLEEESKQSKQQSKKKEKGKQVVAILPLKSQEQNLLAIEDLIVEIIIKKINKEKDNIKFPVRLAEVQKECQYQMKPRDPPLFIILRQLEVDIDQFFYQILESRSNIASRIKEHLSTKMGTEEWAQKLVEEFQSNMIHLFMPFSHESMKAKAEIEEELKKGLTINSIVEVGQFNDYISKRYYSMIKNTDEFDKMCSELFIKYGYRIVKTGTGMYFTNPYAFAQEGASFNYQAMPCPLCMEGMPDFEVLEQMVKDAVTNLGQLDFLQYYGENNKILVVNNYTSLYKALLTFKDTAAVGIDLEGRLRKNGNVSLVQIGTDELIFIFDIYQAQLNQDFSLMEYVNLTMKWLFLNPQIRKVFFDCKRDMEAMHYLFSIGVRNVFDIQAVHMAYTQFREMQINKKGHEQKHVVTPGLNDVLGAHEVEHGVNSLKKKFKKIFSDHKLNNEMFCKRPLDPDFASYAAQDVEDLVELSYLLEAKIETVFQSEDLHHFQESIHPEYRSALVTQLSQAYADISCQKYNKDLGLSPQVEEEKNDK